jgi:hypothetical protein
MDSTDSSHICSIYTKPVDLQQDRYADEDGKVVDEDCYIKRLVSSLNDRPIRTIRNSPFPAQC